MHAPDCTVSIPYDVAESTPSSSRHWKTPWSCGVTATMLTEEPETWKRRDVGPMGSPLNSQVTLGAGFPLATQVKRAEEPAGSCWSVGPSVTDGGSAEETAERREVQLHTGSNRVFVFPSFRLTENFDGVVCAKHVASLRLGATAVNALVGPRHRREDQVVVPPTARRSRRELFAVFEPPGCRRGAAGHDALQRQRLRRPDRHGGWRGGVEDPRRGGGV